jgi:NAD(P)-dependent dehydrogenase (short-subunit alcohol dehydrogenase family)
VHTICFTEQEMEAFADASGDVNPLHLNDKVVVAGGFEAPVVYGVLSVLAALSALKDRPGQVLRRVDASFNRPLFVGSRYRLKVHEGDACHATILIFDSDLQTCTVRASFAEGTMPAARVGAEPTRLPEPFEPSVEELESGLLVTGRYGASGGSMRWLEEHFCLPARGVGCYALHGLLCTSYLIGMRLPGLGSLISRLQFALTQAVEPESAPRCTGPLTYEASVVELEADLGEVAVSGVFEHGERRVAMFTCQTHLSPLLAASDCRRVERYLEASDRLQGRVAVVVGASSGLGAAIAQGMASQGCDVYACSRSGKEPERCASSWIGSIEHACGDGSDPEFCRNLLERIMERHSGVDFLLCCAAPQLSGIGFGTHSMARFNDFLQRSIELVTVPMATFLQPIQIRAGGCLVVSSTALITLPREWGHYVAAKAACEGLAVWSAKRFPEVEIVVARVPRLGRKQRITNGAAGEDTVELEEAAARLVNRLAERIRSGVHLVEW